MSFYLGENTEGNKVLHITKNYSTAETLKAGVYADTIFHSDLNYVTVTKYQGTILNGILTVPASLRTELDAKIWIVVSANGTFINPYTQYDVYSGISYGIWLTSTTMRLASNSGPVWTQLGDVYIPRQVWRSAPILESAHNGVCTIFVFSASETQFFPSVKTDDSIEIGRGSIRIGGVDLAKVGYVSRGVINNVDPQFTVQGIPVQITNVSYGSTEDLRIVSDSSATFISRGSQPIIHSRLGHSMEYKYTSTAYNPANSGENGKYKNVEHKTYFKSRVSDSAFIVMSFPNGTILGNRDGYNSILIPINVGFICFRFVNDIIGRSTVHHLVYIKADNLGITLKNSLLRYNPVTYTGDYFTYHLFD